MSLRQVVQELQIGGTSAGRLRSGKMESDFSCNKRGAPYAQIVLNKQIRAG
jgi:hypothetical protein